LIGRFIEILTLELRIRIKSLGSTTWKRKELRRGLESDECYYIANESRVRGKLELDFTTDPPPDLAVEIDLSRSSARRMGIYAALRVPEVWSFDGEEIRVYLLQADGTYALAERSPSFPFLPVAEVARFVRRIATVDETALVLAFRDWVRAEVLPKLPSTSPAPEEA
jgi:Uma2 family endonuclease